jgi:hypothetical protein
MSEVSGKIIVLNETETVGAAGTFKKRLVVIATDEQYSQSIGIDFVQDKTSILDKYKVGDSVKVSTNIRGQEYKGKYYVSLNGWRIEKLETINPDELPKAEAVFSDSVEASDLPF